MNISINDFAKNKINKTYGTFCINSLQNNTKKSVNQNNIEDILIESKHLKREKLIEIYNDIYNRCLYNIRKADIYNKTDIIFTIPVKIENINDYDPNFCIEFINNKIKESHMNTIILNKTTLFITWKYIEYNKENNIKDNKNFEEYHKNLKN